MSNEQSASASASVVLPCNRVWCNSLTAGVASSFCSALLVFLVEFERIVVDVVEEVVEVDDDEAADEEVQSPSALKTTAR